MKIKLVALFAIAFMTASCNSSYKNPESSGFKNYTFVEIDGCEYIAWTVSYEYLNITHKGNCKNPIHDCKSSGLH